MTRTRVNVWTVSKGSEEAAAWEPWHPVLATYAQVVWDMQLLAESNPDSWLWAANTHGYPGPQRNEATWYTCKHKSPWFLPWHRAFLAWFEATVRKLGEDDGWALPYWDYTDGDPNHLLVPPEFLVEKCTIRGQQEDNPLRVIDRQREVPADIVALGDELAEYRFVRRHKRCGFGGSDVEPQDGDTTLEMQPHNFVHGALGGLMGHPETAGRDPIFWLHHANIDRLWSVWRGLDGSLDADRGGLVGEVADQWESAHFTFGGDGNVSVFRAPDMIDPSSPGLDYNYDNLLLTRDQHEQIMLKRGVIKARDDSAGGGPMALDDAGGGDPDLLWQVTGASEQGLVVHDDGDSVEVPLDSDQVAALGLVEVAAQVPAGLIVSLEGVTADGRPHAFYLVELAAGTDAPRRRVGRISTFGIGPAQQTPASITFDATDLAPQLVDDGWSGGPLVVHVRPDLDQVHGAVAPGEAGLQIEQVTVSQRP